MVEQLRSRVAAVRRFNRFYTRRLGLLTLGLCGGDGGLMAQAGCDFCFVVRDNDALAVQETHETLYHILWELVHVYFEHEGLLT